MTADAKTAVVNAAMAHLGEAPFDSITADPQPPKLTKALGQLDGPAGVEMWALSRHPWLCALAYQQLSPTPNLSDWKWPYYFVLPDSFVKLFGCSAGAFEMGRANVGGAWKKVLRCADASVNVSFTENRDFEAYDPDVCNFMAFELAARCAGPIQDDGQKAEALHGKALEMLAWAESGEANQHREADCDQPVPSRLSMLRRLGS